jgi:hypothetical protein
MDLNFDGIPDLFDAYAAGGLHIPMPIQRRDSDVRGTDSHQSGALLSTFESKTTRTMYKSQFIETTFPRSHE